MNKNNLINIYTMILVYILSNVVMIYNLPLQDNKVYLDTYILIIGVYNLIMILLMTTHITKGIDILEPITLVTGLYLMIFCIVPMINISLNQTKILGVDVMPGANKATLIFLLSYIFFYIGYYTKFIKKQINTEGKFIPNENEDKIVRISVLIWMICYIMTIIYFKLIGKSIMYILTGGVFGEIESNNIISTSMEFLSMFSYSLIPTWMYVYVYGKNKILKIILWVLTLLTYLSRGFRFIIIILALAPIIYIYIEKGKRPKISACVFLALISILGISIVGFTRDSIRFGTQINWNEFNMQFIVESIRGNFEIYMPFYGLVDKIPYMHDYTHGKQLSYTFIMLIPRAIWPTKPSPVLHELIATSVSNYAAIAGVAWPNLGEFYSEFGILGCLIFMFIFGKICSRSKLLYKQSRLNKHSLILYSIVLPSYLQLVIRGYTPSNFYLMVFLIAPVIFMKLIVKQVKMR